MAKTVSATCGVEQVKYVICWRCLKSGMEGRGTTLMSRDVAEMLAELFNLGRPLFDHWVEREG